MAGAVGGAVTAGVAAGATVAGVVAAGMVAWAGAVVAAGGAGFVSISLIFWSKAARAAAWTGVSCAWTEMKLAPMATAQTVGNNLKICINLVFTPIFPRMQQLSPPGKTIFSTSAAGGKTMRTAV